MKKISGFLFLISVYIFFAAPAHADPRMETNKNFCHFILNAGDTDNEVFLAGCASLISVVEKGPVTGTATVECEEGKYMANGYASVTRTMLLAAAPIPAGTTLKFTSNDTDTPCTMVESNGRQYRSYKWHSVIKVDRGLTRNLVKVTYEIFCQEGVQ